MCLLMSNSMCVLSICMAYTLVFMQSTKYIDSISMWSKRSLWSTIHSSMMTIRRVDVPDEVTSHACMHIYRYVYILYIYIYMRLELYINSTIASMLIVHTLVNPLTSTTIMLWLWKKVKYKNYWQKKKKFLYIFTYWNVVWFQCIIKVRWVFTILIMKKCVSRNKNKFVRFFFAMHHDINRFIINNHYNDDYYY